MKKILGWIFACTLVSAYFFVSISGNLTTERNRVAISLSDTNLGSSSLSIAVIGDIHLPEGPAPLLKLQNLMRDIKATQPDLVVFVGDYTASPRAIVDMSSHRENIINAMKLIDPLPRAVVLGNYESWSDPERWLYEFNRLDVDVMENQTRLVRTANGPVCIRGLGDKFTNRYKYVDYPAECQGLPQLTITHDPAGAFDKHMTGLVLAGHTHCGQVSLPLVGPLWVPSEAPSLAHCGFYQDKQRSVFVTSGVGTSILPVRFGAQSQWDELNIRWN
ncbi:metallophosphoesterase [Reinekea sp.]|nr:metallophosphoesterase [Reinekea sp.]